MLPKDKFAEHHYPEVERRFVGIGLTVQREGENIAVFDSFVSDLEVSQLIVRSKIPHYHHRQKAQEDEAESDGQRMSGQEIIYRKFRHDLYLF